MSQDDSRWLVRSITGFSDEATVDALHNLLATPDEPLRPEALRALMRTSDPDRHRYLQHALKSEDPRLRSAAEYLAKE